MVKLHKIEPELIMICVYAVSRGCDIGKQIVEFAEKKDYALIGPPTKGKYSKALATASELGMLVLSGSKPLSSKVELIKPLALPLNTRTQMAAFFQEFLQEYEPFILYLSLMQDGNDSTSAAARTCAILNIRPMMTDELNAFASWGIYAGILETPNGRIQIAPKIQKKSVDKKVKSLKRLIDAMNGKLASRTFIRSFLGQDAYSFLPKEIVSDLVEAIERTVDKPDEAVAKMGVAFEDYLKHFATASGLSLVSSKGTSISAIGPLLKLLRSKRKISKYHDDVLRGLEVFTSKDLFDGLRTYRNLGHHGKDPIEDARWSLSTEVALVGILQLLLSIRSTYLLGIKGKVTY
jgi:hypothetical protein